MIELETRVKIPFLWGKAVFKKSNWSQINLIVGPNGSGKTLLAENLASQFEKAGYSVLLNLVAHDMIGGTYQVENLEGFNQDVWLCNVVHFLFGEHPEKIYFKIQ